MQPETLAEIYELPQEHTDFRATIRRLARPSAACALILMVQEHGTQPIARFGSPELKARFLPRCATGEWSPAFCLSEPDAGSDPAAIRTTAVHDGDEWVINGTKNWITNAGVADFYVVFAVTERRAGASPRSWSSPTARASRCPSTSTSSASTARRPASPCSSTSASLPRT
jgi:alkylation response protein AidB-like acyl-CoA dehydrogenase